jgi:hypothetical protein
MFSQDLLAISKLWFCPPFWWRDTTICLVFSLFTSRLTFLLVSDRVSVFYLWYLCFHPIY